MWNNSLWEQENQVFSPTLKHSSEPKAMNMAQITVMKGNIRAVVAHCGKTIMNTIMKEKAVFNAPNGQTEAVFSYFLTMENPGSRKIQRCVSHRSKQGNYI